MTKVISLSEEAYKKLKRLKRRGESFSDVVMKITKNAESKSLLEFAGTWSGDDIDSVFKNILDERNSITSRKYQL